MTDYEQDIERQILSGLPDDQDRLSESVRVLHYYELNEPFVRRNPGDNENLPIENSALVRRVIQIRNSLLYNPPPSRGIDGNDNASAFLDLVYENNIINDLLGKAAELADLLDVSAVGVIPGIGNKPICLYLLDYTQFVLKSDEDDFATVAHIIILDQTGDGRMRYTWWTADFKRVYVAKARDSRATYFVNETLNPYGRIPFALFHSELPFRGLTSNGIGDWLAKSQEKIDSNRYKLSLGYSKYCLPQMWAKGVRPDWQPSNVIGEYMRIPAGEYQGASIVPELGFIQAPIDLVQLNSHIDADIDRVLQGAGVPRPLYYLESQALSGAAIYAEQQPLRDFSKRKQESLKLAETDLAEAILAVGSTVQTDPSIAEDFRNAGISGVKLTVAWEPQISTSEDTAQDLWDLEHGLQSLVDVTRSRYGLATDAEAVRKLLKVAKDNQEIKDLLGLLPHGKLDDINEGDPIPPTNTTEENEI